ncbi:MAG: TOBE domain-containing protein [Tardiphaga sp.]|nr:TOBE domain-containing protein [Tardiphaga sp.]
MRLIPPETSHRKIRSARACVAALGLALALAAGAHAQDDKMVPTPIPAHPTSIELGTGAFSGRVVHLENMGSEAFVHIGLESMGSPVVARINDPRRLPLIGSSISCGFVADAVRAFDAGGKRIDTVGQPQLERAREIALV